MLDLWLKVD